jgi:hypothetical protein
VVVLFKFWSLWKWSVVLIEDILYFNIEFYKNTYGAETWTLNTQQANKLLATEMDFLEKIG